MASMSSLISDSSAAFPLVLSVFEVWVPSQRNQCNGSKKDPNTIHCFRWPFKQFGNFFCPDRFAGKRHGNPDPSFA